jgi:hypothetical protein
MSFLDYAVGQNASSDVCEWVTRRIGDSVSITDGEHVIDYLLSDKRPKRLDRMT